MWLVRLAAWGTVLVMAVVAFNVRTGASAPDRRGELRNGRTDERAPVWAVVDGETVQELGITWDFECEDGTELRKFSATFGPGQLRREGRQFRATEGSTLREAPDGWVPHVRSELSGRVETGGTVTGTSEALLWFQRGSERGAVCRSGPVSWTIPAT